ncbi:MAG: V-type ATP synthase subunit D [Thermoanaerobaculia bacterium]
MSAVARLAPTRTSLLRARRRLDRVGRGIVLLRRKREALVTELFRTARPAVEARERIQQAADRAYETLPAALAAHGEPGLTALGRPSRGLEVEVERGQVWGLEVPRITGRDPVRRSLAARGTAPGPAGPAATAAAEGFEELLELLLEAAPRELLLRQLGAALARTSRQLGTLERRLAPALETEVRRIAATLEERERDEHLRLRRLTRSRARR